MRTTRIPGNRLVVLVSVFTLLVLACSTPQDALNAPRSGDDLASASPRDEPTASSPPEEMHGKPLLSLEKDKIEVGIERRADDERFTIIPAKTSAGEAPSHRVMKLQKPDRLVIDFPSLVGVRDKVVRLDSPALVTAVRLGSHADKSRLVLDLGPDADPDVRVTSEESRVLVSVHRSSASFHWPESGFQPSRAPVNAPPAAGLPPAKVVADQERPETESPDVTDSTHGKSRPSPIKRLPLPASAAPPQAGEPKSSDKETSTTSKESDPLTEIVSSDSEKQSDPVLSFLDENARYVGRLVSLDLQDTDIDNALRIIAEVSNLNIIASDDVTGKVTLRLLDVPWDQALDVILKTNGLDKVREGNVIRIAPVEKLRAEREALKEAQTAEDELEPLRVKYIRVSYAKAAELQPLIETVITERGKVTFDERTNQLIVKDTRAGVGNVAKLVAKLDLRTPQVLLETQIVEANRSILRDLGNEFGFRLVQSPSTGNARGSEFPNSVDLTGAISNSVPGAPNPIALLLGSADGALTISDRITALETEGRVRVVSRPTVATMNNKEAVIKSVQKIRVKLPTSGVSVATGQGAMAQGQGNSATETIDVGIILTVTAQASPDYYVHLDINAKSSTLGPVLGSDGIPSEIERSATSSVLVSSGQTFALGGIYKISENSNVGGLPFFSDVPVLGHLFRRSQVSHADEELLFFLTPRIVEGSFDDAAMKAAA